MAYFSLREKAIKKLSEEGHKNAIEARGEDDEEAKDSISFEDLPYNIQEIEFNEGELTLDIEIKTPSSDALAFVSLEVPIDLDLAAEIVSFYVKKLNKLKTVLEATKD